jgi:hypothetical protein
LQGDYNGDDFLQITVTPPIAIYTYPMIMVLL